jgi:hypothetical protein
VLGIGRIFLQFFAQVEDEVVHGSGGRHRIIAPYLVQQVMAVDGLAGMLDQIAQQIEFLGGEFHFPVIYGRLVFFEIQSYTAERVMLQFLFFRRTAPQKGADPATLSISCPFAVSMMISRSGLCSRTLRQMS